MKPAQIQRGGKRSGPCSPPLREGNAARPDVAAILIGDEDVRAPIAVDVGESQVGQILAQVRRPSAQEIVGAFGGVRNTCRFDKSHSPGGQTILEPMNYSG
jgi:hypothetical protein